MGTSRSIATHEDVTPLDRGQVSAFPAHDPVGGDPSSATETARLPQLHLSSTFFFRNARSSSAPFTSTRWSAICLSLAKVEGGLGFSFSFM